MLYIKKEKDTTQDRERECVCVGVGAGVWVWVCCQSNGKWMRDSVLQARPRAFEGDWEWDEIEKRALSPEVVAWNVDTNNPQSDTDKNVFFNVFTCFRYSCSKMVYHENSANHSEQLSSM